MKQILRKVRDVLRFLWEEYAEARESAVHYGIMLLYALVLWFLFVAYPFWAGLWFSLWPGLAAFAFFKSGRDREREELRREISRYRLELEALEAGTRARIEQEVEEKWRTWAEKGAVLGSHPGYSTEVAFSTAAEAPALLTGAVRSIQIDCPTKASDNTDEASSPEALAVEFIDTTFDCHGPLPFRAVLAQAKELGMASEVAQCFPSAYEVVYSKTSEGSRAEMTSPNAVYEEWSPRRIHEFLSGSAARNQIQPGEPHADDEKAVAENPAPSTSPSNAQASRTRKRAEEDIWALGKYQPPEWMKDRVYRVKFDPLAWKGLEGREPKVIKPCAPPEDERPLAPAPTSEMPAHSSAASAGKQETVWDLLNQGWKVKAVHVPSDPKPEEPPHSPGTEVQTGDTLWAPPGTDPVIFVVRVPASTKSLRISQYRHLLMLMMAERAERDGLTGAGVIEALGPAIGAGAAEQILVEWDEDPDASPEREIWRAIDLAWEVSILDQALGVAGMPERGPLEVGPMSEVRTLVARESVSDLGLEDWAQQIPDGPDRA